jgi:spore photoproduct lyase
MLIYIEHQAKNYPQTAHIISTFPRAEIVWIKHYKNLFDKNISYATQDCLIVARLIGKALLPVPETYGYGAHAYFLRTQLNCVFDCAYCYLKWAFRNDFPVYFVNYNEIQEQIVDEVARVRMSWYLETIWIYPSNRTDLVGSEHIGSFHQQFVPFFESLENVMIESRTKSTIMKPLLNLSIVPQHTELAFSLNAHEIIAQFERATPPLEKRINAVNQILDAGWKVGLRLMPLIPIPEYLDIYEHFFQQLHEQIAIDRCSSIFFGWFLLTANDLKQMQKKSPESALRPLLHSWTGSLCRTGEHERNELYQLIRKYFPMAQVSMDEL